MAEPSCFNPHTHTGCDVRSVFEDTPNQSFNPHTHTGCDAKKAAAAAAYKSFNPHTHTGCDSNYGYNSYKDVVSIHTPIQGVTFRPVAPSPRARVSIHTPIQGVTPFAAVFVFGI